MKRFFAMLLAIIMIATATPMMSHADEAPEKTLFSAYDIYYDAQIANFTTVQPVLEISDGVPYASMKAEPGTYGNGALMMTIKSSALKFNVTEYPFIAVGYKTDAVTPGVDITMMYDNNETWRKEGGSRYKITSNGKLEKLICNALDLNAKVEIKPDYQGIDIRLKFWGGHTQVLSTNQYFDVAYIAFFKTLDEANAFVYNPITEEEYFAESDLKIVNKTVTDVDENTLLSYLAQAEALKYDIINTPNTEFPQAKKTYYVSPDGDDNNDGLSPETAWKSLEKVGSATYGKDDVVRFKRGGIWRGTLNLKNGVIYSAYGEGPKPEIWGSIPGEGAENWELTDAPNVWAFTTPLENDKHPGNIVFNEGEAWGIHVYTDGKGNRHDQGTVFNGIETVECPPTPYTGYKDIFHNNLEFWYDEEAKTVYMYCEYGNPGEYFDDIELSLRPDMVSGGGKYIIFDNICLKYGGGHGVSVMNSESVTVQNCVFGWLGGGGLGNAVQNWDNCKDFTINHNYAYQIYDCAWTTQSSVTYADRTMVDVVMTNNISERCNTGVEIWLSGDNTDKKGLLKNFTVENNFTLYGGCGWSHQRRRDIKDGNFVFGGTGIDRVVSRENMHFENNVNIHATHIGLYARFIGPAGFMFDNNVYMMQRGKSMASAASNLKDGSGSLIRYPYDEKGISTLATLGNDVNSTFYYLADDFEPHTDSKLQDFTDVYGHWGLENISFAVMKGLFSGTTDTTFSPNAPMTRAMLVTVLSRLAGDVDTNAVSGFSDVKADAWYTSAVAWAEAKGIVDKGASFRPDANATREEMADMLYRFAKAYGKDTSKKAELKFTDASSIKCKDAVAYCVGAGIIAGYSDNTVKPAGEATRTEVATMLKRFIFA
ncbi:MAG: S-layer homology domain-containing protein [Clostridia bacterium]|nr:S-layer homology domain-containing protein [Clostridia bacterium]